MTSARIPWVGPYQTLEELGRGATSVVYRARSTEGREVAVKVVRRPSSEVASRFERERGILELFGEREGFVPLIDSGSTPSNDYIVMPFMSGGTLRDRLRRGPLALADALAIGIALARALGRAHERGVVHRDLKPENVLFTSVGDPLVADLGLAKHFHGDAPGARNESLSRTGDFLGTAGYMAPEQMANAKAVGPEVDVFALGAILHECLSGTAAFAGEGILDTVARVASGERAALRRQRPEVPRWLERVIDRALASEPAQRFPDGSSFARALESGGRPGRIRTALLALGLAIVAGGIAAALSQRDSSPVVLPSPLASTPVPRSTSLAVPPKGPVAPRSVDPDPAVARSKASALLERARTKAQQGDDEGTIADCTEALGLAPDLCPALELRAKTRRTRGDAAGAIADFLRLTELLPGNSNAWYLLGVARATMKEDLDGALTAFDRALELNPGNVDALANRAAARYRKDDLEGAIADNTKAIELDPAFETPWLNRGFARARTGDTAGARSDLEKVLRLVAPGSSLATLARQKLAELPRAP